jgi:hypothetical protein
VSSVAGRQDVYRTCAVCSRTILLGEQASRFSPGGDEWVDVCPLCVDVAGEHGWIREGAPTTPVIEDAPRRRWRLPRLRFRDGRKPEPEPVVAEPILRRLPPDEQALVEAAERFNETPYPRTIAGIAKSLGEPRISMLLLSGVNPEVVITIAWDISWYQYRVVFDSAQPVRLAERGNDVNEVAERFRGWNASLDGDGRITPDIPRL